MVNSVPVISAAILAGGEAKRLGGCNKGLVELGGQPLLRHVITALEGLFEEIFLVTRHPDGLTEFGHRIALDRYDHRCSLTGIHAALDGADTPFVFTTACDTPFLQPNLVHALMEQIGCGADVIVPVRDGWYYYPLCAIYSKSCLPVIEAQLDQGKLQTVSFLKQVKVATIPLESLLPYDPTLCSLFNVNTPQDIQTAQAMLPCVPSRRGVEAGL
ncbi:MAG: molybdenum cofactor guanylyltransferase [Proteobacteria bacterium]|nr:molybdenum cofactor guanylyltransferase [Pseudomonadota bacterium]